MNNLNETNQKIADKLFSTNKKIEETVVSNHQKIADSFVDTFLRKKDETLDEAQHRLKAEQQARKATHAKKQNHHAK